MKKKRCFGDNSELYANYHDDEWGIPVYDDRLLFEMLILEGAQAGLSWETILKKRDGYRKAFHNFDVKKISRMQQSTLDKLRENPEIVRNKLKINSVKINAKVFIEIQKEYGSFSDFLWGHVKNKHPIKNRWKSHSEVPVSTALSDEISRELKNRGMKFVGTTIIYAYLQAVGVVYDHLTNCQSYKK